MTKSQDIIKYIHLLDKFLEDPLHAKISNLEVAKALKKIYKDDEELFVSYLQKIPNEFLGDIALEFPEKYLKEFIEQLPKGDLVEVVSELDSDDAVDLLQDIEDINQETADQILDSLDKDDQEDIKKLKLYDENQAGAYMQTELFSAYYDELIQTSINRFKELKLKGELDNTHNVFILDSFDRLMFTLSLEDLLTFDFKNSYRDELSDLEGEAFKVLHVSDDTDISDVVHLFEEHELSALPVLSKSGHLLGRITADDIHTVIQDSATEQIYNLAGVDDEAEDEENFFEAGKKRGTWLFINLLTAILASSVIQIFDTTLQSFISLAILMPIVASMGGNAGTQTLTVTVRRLALGDIDLESSKDTIIKEVLLSLANGLIFALILGFISVLWFSIPMLGVVIALSMIINLFMAGFFGAVIPLVLKRLNVDPAVGSSVILTTVTDIVGFFSFLGLAKLILI